MGTRHGQAQDAGSMEQPGPGAGGLDVFAGLSLRLGRIADVLEGQARDAQQLAADITPFNIQLPQLPLSGGAGNSSGFRQLLRPSDGYAWDVKLITAASFTAGTVSVYRGSQADNNLRFVWTVAGTYTFGTAQFLIRAGEHMLFTATGITGSVSISFDGIQVASPLLAEYLL